MAAPKKAGRWGQEVLDKAESDRSPAKYPIAELRKTETLIVSSEHGKKQLDSLKEQGLSGYRPVRGDGNCFYRALGFHFLETLAGRVGGWGIDVRGLTEVGSVLFWVRGSSDCIFTP